MLDQYHAGARFRMGQSLLSTGDVDGALDMFRVALTVRPQDGAFHAAAATAHQVLGDAAAAAEAFERAISLDHVDADVHYGLGVAYQVCDTHRLVDSYHDSFKMR